MLPATVDRVPRHAAEDVNRRIRRDTEQRVRAFALNPAAIEHRLRELDEEWDIERLLEANASTLAFVGTVLGATLGQRWLILPAPVTAFLFLHAVQGWCPPVPILRRWSYRTAREIDIERVALKALPGDFALLCLDEDVESRAGRALQAARL
jgi:hypothetical protein